MQFALEICSRAQDKLLVGRVQVVLESLKCWSRVVEITFDYIGVVGRARLYHTSERTGTGQDSLEVQGQ